MFLLVIHVVLLPTQHLRFDKQKFYWAYAASTVHILYGRKETLNLPSTMLPWFHTSKFSLYSIVSYTDKTSGDTRYNTETYLCSFASFYFREPCTRSF